MKTIKMSLANIEGKISRKEMKGIMAGSSNYGNVQGQCTQGSIGTFTTNSMEECHRVGAEYCRSGSATCTVIVE